MILISVFYSKFIKKDEIIQVFGKSFLIVVTGSMEPTIEAGELVIISDEKDYKIGDIITYVDEDGYVITHRIIKIDEKGFITKGDGNNIEDEENKLELIKGKVVFHSKIMGFFILYMLKPLAVIYAVIFIIINIIKISKKSNIKKRNVNENE